MTDVRTDVHIIRTDTDRRETEWLRQLIADEGIKIYNDDVNSWSKMQSETKMRYNSRISRCAWNTKPEYEKRLQAFRFTSLYDKRLGRRSHRDIQDTVWFWEGLMSSVLSINIQWLLHKRTQHEAPSPEVKAWYMEVFFSVDVLFGTGTVCNKEYWMLLQSHR